MSRRVLTDSMVEHPTIQRIAWIRSTHNRCQRCIPQGGNSLTLFPAKDNYQFEDSQLTATCKVV